MVSHGCRGLGLGVSAVAGASLLGLTTLMTGPPAFAADTALIVGGTGIPTPPQSYVDAIQNLYLDPLGYGSYTPVSVTTPEQYYPLTGPNSVTVDTSVAEGVTALDAAIRSQLAAGNNPVGNKVVVVGYSQGASVTSQEAADLAASPNPPSPDQVSFILLGDPSTPNGGFTTRYQIPGTPPLSLPALGLTFNTAPTGGTPYPTTVYNQEYDLAGDAPQYPLNFLSDLNATLGFVTQHGGYLNLTPDQISSAVQLQTTGGNTTYYMIPTPNLPLLAPVRLLPLVGDPLADLVQPDLRVLVNLGYGNLDNGWSAGPANVATPIGLWPTNTNPADVVTALANGIPQGITNAVNDLKTPQLIDLSPLSLFLEGANTVGWTPSATPSLLQLVDAFAILDNTGTPVTPVNLGSSLLSLPKVLADTGTALAVNLPQYDARLFTSQLASGNVLNAVGLPIAADLGVAPFVLVAGGVFPIAEAVATPVAQVAQLAGLVPNPLAAPVTAASTTPVGAASTKPVAAASIVSTDTEAATTNAKSAVSTNAGANAANAPKTVQSVVSMAVSSVTTPVRTAISSVATRVRTALTGGSKPLTPAVGKPTTPAAVTSTPTGQIRRGTRQEARAARAAEVRASAPQSSRMRQRATRSSVVHDDRVR